MLLKIITTIIFLDVFIILKTFSFAIKLCKFDSTLLGSVMIPSILNKCLTKLLVAGDVVVAAAERFRVSLEVVALD